MLFWKRFKTKIQRGLFCNVNWFNVTKLLYAINIVLLFTLLYMGYFAADDGHVDAAAQFLSTATGTTFDAYYALIDNSMQVFDYMQQMKLGQISIKTDFDVIKRTKQNWCWNYPTKPLNDNIVWSADIWQVVQTSHLTEIYVYSAYYDTRQNEAIPDARSFVQVFAMVQEKLDFDIFCQIWWPNDERPFIAKAIVKHIWEKSWDPRTRFYVPFLFICPITQLYNEPAPISVSISQDACGSATNSLQIEYNMPKDDKKKHTVVCVKGMDFLDDMSTRFVEWLEANYLAGADKVVIYTYAVHPEMRRVIEYYERNKRVENIPLTLPGQMPNVPLHRSRYIKRNRQQKRRNEIIPYNDCMYKHLYTHEYVLIVDVDELIVPLMHNNWKEMLDFIKLEKRGDPTTYTAFSIANAFFFDNLTTNLDQNYPSHLHMMRHDIRSRDVSAPGVYGKSFMFIDNIATVFNHFPLHKLKKNLRKTLYVDSRIALKNHYKEVCPIESRDECPSLYSETMQDRAIRKYAEDLKRNVEVVLNDLKKL